MLIIWFVVLLLCFFLQYNICHSLRLLLGNGYILYMQFLERSSALHKTLTQLHCFFCYINLTQSLQCVESNYKFSVCCCPDWILPCHTKYRQCMPSSQFMSPWWHDVNNWLLSLLSLTFIICVHHCTFRNSQLHTEPNVEKVILSFFFLSSHRQTLLLQLHSLVFA